MKQIDQAFISRLQELQQKNDEEATARLKEAYFAVSDYSRTRSSEAELEQEISKSEGQTIGNSGSSDEINRAKNFSDSNKESRQQTDKKSDSKGLSRDRYDHLWPDSFFREFDLLDRDFFGEFFPARFLRRRGNLWFDEDPFFRRFKNRMREFEREFDRRFDELRDIEINNEENVEASKENSEKNSNETSSNDSARKNNESKQFVVSKNQTLVNNPNSKTFEAVSETTSEVNGKKVVKSRKLIRDEKGINTVQERVEDENGVRTKNYKVSDEEFRNLIRGSRDLEVLALE